MKKFCYFIFTLAFCFVHIQSASVSVRDAEQDLQDYLTNEYQGKAVDMCNRLQNAEWAYAIDIDNAQKQQELLDLTLVVAAERKQIWTEKFQNLKIEDYTSEELKRQVKKLKLLGNAALDEASLTEFTTVTNSMSNTYSTAKICPYEKQTCQESEKLTLEPGIEKIMSTSDNYDELLYAWKAWRDATGAKIKSSYGKYVELKNKVAQANGYTNAGELWKDGYETENFEEKLDELWNQVKPLYDELHKYVAKKLKERYGDKLDIEDGLIPAHVLGNMWAQSWVNLASLVKPYPDASEVDVTQAMKDQGYTVTKMFEESNVFYKSLGLKDNSMSYGEKAMIEKPDRDVLCHASAWDFCDGEDFRIKMCTQIDMEDFITVHHEMGHIQYYLQYKDLPIALRGGANPGFHEAVGDTIALSVATPTHLKKIGMLSDDYEDSKETSINALMDMALERVAFLPFGLLIDKWRWDVFSGKVTEDKWNDKWWEYRENIQKVKRPEPSKDTDFDPAAKFHVAGDSQYINYFVAHILEFQMYRGLCAAAGQYNLEDPDEKPLHECDFYESKEAGSKLSAGLSLGTSKHWSEALKAMTGETELDASALLDYFQPLYNWLKTKNMAEEELKEFLEGEYATGAKQYYYNQVDASWNAATDVNDKDKQQAEVDATLALAEFQKKHWTETFQYLEEDDYQDELLKRQIHFLKVLGNAALSPEKLSELTDTILQMSNIYSSAKICPFDKQDCDLSTDGLTLEPGIEAILSKSVDYDELVYAWTEWRKMTGAKMKDLYKTYVELSNEAANENDFEDKGKLWMSSFETDNFIEQLDKLWNTVKPLYEELHKYVASKLKERYGDKLDIEDGLIPAHVLGNMWAQSWINLSPLVKPYPDASEVDVTKAMQDAQYTIKKMFEISDEFYQSMGLMDNSMSYGEGTMIEKPDWDVLCHASAWDFYDQKTFRIKMCTEVDYEDFITVHHEMGHIQYFLQYKDQPIVLRDGANPGFHEAVGDTIALSVATPTHLKKIGLLGDDYQDSEEASINALMDMALERVAFLPFGLLIDKWRWDVFNGTVTQDQWNEHWWEYRKSIQKVKPPIERSENDFDPGAKYHVAGDSQYISYFIAHILEFQLYRSLCVTAGQYDLNNKEANPLHKCDFYESTEAGDKLSAGLKLGSSKHWKQVLKEMTGDEDLDASALVEYFDPLYQYLKEYNSAFTTTSSIFTLLLGLLTYYFLA